MATDITIDHILKTDPPRFALGLNGLAYAVFDTNCYSYEYCDLSGSSEVVHFGNYENGVLLQPTLGLDGIS